MKSKIKTDNQHNVLELQLNVLVFQEGEYYVAFCPSLNLSTYGNSVGDAKDAFDDAMNIYLDYSNENGTLHQDLIKHGWQFGLENNKKVEPPSMVELNIPAGLLKTQFNENWTVPVS